MLALSACSGKTAHPDNQESRLPIRTVFVPEFASIIDSANVIGSILIYDDNSSTYYSNDFEWAKRGRLPASTFKITNSIIALETGIIENDSTLFIWNGEDRRLQIWEQDLHFQDALHYSCVPCYQEVARKIGADRMSDHLDKLDYGSMQVDSSNIDLFWLEGDSRISQFQQIEFLQRFYDSELPISARTETIMKRMLVLENHDQYTISGKTGWSIRNGNNNGWFVGYLESKDKIYFFATNVEPQTQFDMSLFPMIRAEVTYKAFQQMNLL